MSEVRAQGGEGAQGGAVVREVVGRPCSQREGYPHWREQFMGISGYLSCVQKN